MLAPRDRPLRIACIGECMIELSDLSADDGRARLGVAGDTLNTAVYLSRLLKPESARISYLTAIGQDRLSDRMLAFMASEGIDTAHVARLGDRLPGIYAIELDAEGERQFRYWREASAARSMFRPEALDLAVLDAFDLIYLSGITLAILPEEDRAALLSKLAELKEAGRTIAFDSNYRPRLWADRDTARRAIGRAWTTATIALPSLDDEIALEGPAEPPHIMIRLARQGAAEIALKRGAEGPMLHVDGELLEDAFPTVDDVRDTTAAGDAFNAGYLSGRISGHDPLGAAHLGHALAAQVIRQPGAIVDIMGGGSE